MARDDTATILATVPLFASLSKRDRSRVAREATVTDVAAGAELVREGDPGREFYLILDGSFTVRRNRRKVATLGPGDYFGELAVLDGTSRSATVVADTAARVVVLGQRQLAGVLEATPALAAKLLVAMAGRLRDADKRAYAH